MGFIYSGAQSGTEKLAEWLGAGKPQEASRPPNPQVDRAKAEEDAIKKNDERKRRLRAGGRSSTFHTSSAGAFGQPASVKKELFGE